MDSKCHLGSTVALEPKHCGIGVVCSPTGLVTRVVYDGLGLGEPVSPGIPFSGLFDSHSVEKSRRFLRALVAARRVNNWTLSVNAVPLQFAGSEHNGHLEIVGASTHAEMEKILCQFPEYGCEGRGRSFHALNIESNRESNKAAENLERRCAELGKISAEKTRWLEMAAHDLRNPVSAILASSELLMEDGPRSISEEQRSMLQLIHSSGESMLQLLNNLAEVAVLESTAPPLSREPTDLRLLIEECISLSLPLARRKQSQILLRDQESVPLLNLDTCRMRQVLMNLIEHAVKYSQSAAIVEVGAVLNGGSVLISVRDNGPGVTPDEIDKIFTPFQKTRARAASAEHDTGLGIVTCKWIVDQHGGRIWVESTLGHGTTFNVSLPVEAGPDIG